MLTVIYQENLSSSKSNVKSKKETKVIPYSVFLSAVTIFSATNISYKDKMKGDKSKKSKAEDDFILEVGDSPLKDLSLAPASRVFSK